MAESERKQIILEYLKANGKATVEQLAEMLFVSSASIRRDLTEMQAAGLVKRTHGGVLFNTRSDVTSVNIRRTQNPELKEKTANIAIHFLPDFETIFIDDSSTCFILAEKMDLKNKTVVTNGLELALRLTKRGVNVIMPGGNLQASTGALIGSIAIENIRRLRFDACLVSCMAIDEHNTYEASMDNVALKANVLQNSKQRLLLADSTKIGKTALFASFSTSFYHTIFTDADDSVLVSLRENCPVVNKVPTPYKSVKNRRS